MTTTSESDSTSPVTPASIQNVPVTVDSKGRVRVSKAQRDLILAEFEHSGVSAAQFAPRTGLKQPSAGWEVVSLYLHRFAFGHGGDHPSYVAVKYDLAC